MKQVLKKLGCILLVLSLVLSWIPADAVSFRLTMPVVYQTESLYLPGPLEPDQQIRVTEAKTELLPAQPFGEVEYLTDPAAAGAIVREAMKNHQATVTVYYAADASISFEDVVALIREAAKAHTGQPTEGDYLAWQHQGLGAKARLSSDGITNFYTIEFTIECYTTAEQEAQMDTAVAQLLSELALTGKSDYEKLCAVYDWMCANITYDYDNLNDETYMLKYTAYAALINRTAVCQGYAVLLYRLMLELGIDCRVITGIGNGGGHAWNIVELDGLYYNADATWDTSWLQAGVPYAFFLRTDATFGDHIRDAEYATADFYAEYPMSTTDYTPTVITEIASGTWGDNISWSLLSDGRLTISGVGSMHDFEINSTEAWHPYASQITSVKIENGVTGIGAAAFRRCSALTQIEIPFGVTGIGARAFSYCGSLTEVTLPAGVVTIGEYAFHECASLESIVIPDGVTEIGINTFELCSSLVSAVIGEGVSGLPMSMFEKCTSLKNVVLPASATYIGLGMFMGCSSLESIVIPGNVTSMEMFAFSDCDNLKNVQIPDSVTTIAGYVFSGCSSLNTVTIGSGLTSLGDGVFYECGQLTVTFAGNAPVLGADLFYNTTAEVYYPADNATWTADVMQNYSGTVTWVPYGNVHVHSHTPVVTAPTCTVMGYTTYTCTCGDSYQTDFVDHLGHDFAGDATVCAGCGMDKPLDYGFADGTYWVLNHDGTLVIAPRPFCVPELYREPKWDTYGPEIISQVTTIIFQDGMGHVLGEALCAFSNVSLIVLPAGFWEFHASAFTFPESGTDLYFAGDPYDWEMQVAYNEVFPATVRIHLTADEPDTHILSQTVEATCQSGGYTQYSCGCGHSWTAEHTPIADHSWSEWVTTLEPTENAEGEESRTCSGCGEAETRTLPKLEHVHSYTAVVTAPTCTEDGFTTHTCACGDSYVDSYVDAAGHSWDEGVVTKEPTVEAEGEKTYTCAVCGGTKTEALPKLPDVTYDVPEDDSVQIPENDCFEGGTTVKVEEVTEEEVKEAVAEAMKDVAQQYIAYEFTATKDDAQVQPSGKLTVTFTIPEGYSNNVTVYYMAPNGELHKLDAVVNSQDRTVTVQLEHFSTYILVDEDTAPAVLLGDVNGDGRINARDARALLRYIAGLDESGTIEEAAADFNGDGRINARDARALLRAIAGLD